MRRISGPEDVGSGVVFLLLAAAFLVGIRGADHGTVSNMGPAFLPRHVAGLLALIGFGLILRGLRVEAAALPPIRPRAIIFPLAAVLLFAVALHPLGLAATAALVVIVSAAAEPRRDWARVAGLALALAVASCLLFPLALGLPLPIWPQPIWPLPLSAGGIR